SFVLYSYEIPPTTVAIKLISTLTRKRGGVRWSYHAVPRRRQDGARPPDAKSGQNEVPQAAHLLPRRANRPTGHSEPEWGARRLPDHTRDLAGGVGALGGVLVDYVQLVQPPPGRYENREHEVTIVAKELKRLAVEIRCPVVTAAQIGREAAQVTDWVP